MLHYAEQRPDVILLDEGLAIAADRGFDFVCAPGTESEGISATTVGDTVLVSDGSSGLFILQSDGSLNRHPTWAEQGSILQLNSTDGHGYALVRTQDETRLVQFDASSTTALHRFSWPLTTMTTAGSKVLLTGVEGLIAHWVELEAAGAPPRHRALDLPPEVVAVFPRLADDQAFLVLLFSQAAGSELCAVTNAGLMPIHGAATIIAGPVAYQEQLYVAYNGRLGVLQPETDGVRDLPTEHPVTCVGVHLGVGYACTTVGLGRLEANGVGDALFSLDEIAGPAHSSCSNAWLSYRLELQQAGVSVPDLTGPSTRVEPNPEPGQATTPAAEGPAESEMPNPGDPRPTSPSMVADGGMEKRPDAAARPAKPALDAGALAEDATNDSQQSSADDRATDTTSCGCRIGKPQAGGSLTAVTMWVLALMTLGRAVRSNRP